MNFRGYKYFHNNISYRVKIKVQKYDRHIKIRVLIMKEWNKIQIFASMILNILSTLEFGGSGITSPEMQMTD